MKRALFTSLLFLVVIVSLSSCASYDILKALHIDSPSSQEQTADQKTILHLRKQLADVKRDLRKQLAVAKENEAILNDNILKLKTELHEKEIIISIQGMVIGLLDDAEQTLQKSIEDQIKNR